jgi:hypothetical protein
VAAAARRWRGLMAGAAMIAARATAAVAECRWRYRRSKREYGTDRRSHTFDPAHACLLRADQLSDLQHKRHVISSELLLL